MDGTSSSDNRPTVTTPIGVVSCNFAIFRTCRNTQEEHALAMSAQGANNKMYILF